MSLSLLSKVLCGSVLCFAVFVLGGRALATIEISGNAAPLVNTPGNFAAGGVVIGINGNPPPSGDMFVNGGSVLTSTSGIVGELFNGVGNASVASGGTWNISGPLNVGLAGHGQMNASGNNAVSATAVTLGAQLGAGGQLTISGSNPLTSPGGLVVGDAGSGQFTVGAGFGPTTASLPFVNLGDETSGNGTASMEAGTTWNIAGHLGVGVRGTGTLNVVGNTVPVGPPAALNTATATLGDQVTGAAIQGTANLSGNSLWTNTGALVVGNAAKAATTMSTGSRLSALSPFRADRQVVLPRSPIAGWRRWELTAAVRGRYR
jgi:T5SS/PEP-CTERM-associated repeat protein